jgi:hypothetical protein
MASSTLHPTGRLSGSEEVDFHDSSDGETMRADARVPAAVAAEIARLS